MGALLVKMTVLILPHLVQVRLQRVIEKFAHYLRISDDAYH